MSSSDATFATGADAIGISMAAYRCVAARNLVPSEGREWPLAFFRGHLLLRTLSQEQSGGREMACSKITLALTDVIWRVNFCVKEEGKKIKKRSPSFLFFSLLIASSRASREPIALCTSMVDGTCSCRCTQEKCKTNGATCRSRREASVEDVPDIPFDTLLSAVDEEDLAALHAAF